MVTGVWVHLAEGGYDPGALREALAVPFDVRDSKRVFKQAGLARGETAALSFVGSLTGEIPSSAGSLLELLGAAVPPGDLPCSAGAAPPLCGDGTMSLPLWCDQRAAVAGARSLEPVLRGLGVERSGVACSALCAWGLNRRLSGHEGKLDVDLAMMLDVARRIREVVADDVAFTCGKVGARMRYASALPHGAEVVGERRCESSYEVRSLGRLAFVMDADDSDPLVSMASVIGKYVREVAMESVHRFVADLIPGERRPSGYRDPVTDAFLGRCRVILGNAGVPCGCLERIK